jgi:CDP-2,3-bis-(O-geranylgeranyl)-sn-glycerol synthase
MFPVIFGKLNFPLGTPINEKLFGAHKTYRGFYAGFFGALLIIMIQKNLYLKGVLTQYSLIEYDQINVFIYAFLFGFGTITGDTIKSFFKRKMGIKAGRPWFPFDQTDFIIGSYLFLLPLFILPWQNFLTLLLITPILHFLVNVLAYFLGLKKVWW